MSTSHHNGHQVEQAMSVVVSRIAPRLRNSSIARSALEDALVELNAPDLLTPLRVALRAALKEARISVVEDSAGLDDWADLPVALPPVAAPMPTVAPSDPVVVGRRRLELDRGYSPGRLAKVILSAEEEVGLALIARPGGDALEPGGFALLVGEAREAAEALVLHNIGLAHSVCKAYVGQGLEYDDLAQSTMAGLVRAVELFDPSAGYKFSTYASHWLRQAATRAIANEARLVRLPVHMWELMRKVVLTRIQMTSAEGVPPSRSALARACDTTEEKVLECLKLAPGAVSLDTPLGEDGFTLGDLVDAQTDTVEHIEVHGLFPEDLEDLLGYLSEREEGVIRRRFGLAPYDEVWILEAIGKDYGVTRERIRQIESKAMARLRTALARRHPELVRTVR